MKIEDLPEDIHKYIKPLGPHWIWCGDTKSIKFNGGFHKVTRVIYHLLTGWDINDSLQLNHKLECQLEYCVHPDCLYLGTQADNMRDREQLGNNWHTQKTHCPKGHEYNVSPSTGHRYCPTCKTERKRLWRDKKRQAGEKVT